MNWIAVDWGTTNMRAWLIGADSAVKAKGSSPKGMGRLDPDEFEDALLEVVGDWIDGPTDVVCCGMVGARQGWAEAGYTAVPAVPLGNGITQAAARDPRLNVVILAGMSQSAPPDVMRGEETQIAGFSRGHPHWDGVICLPGTHTKWVEISAGEVVSFRTFMTGELFGALSESTVLRHSVAAAEVDDAAFTEAVHGTLAHPARLALDLFGIRAASLLQGISAPVARARLSGALIGAELAAARPYWLGREVVLIGPEELCARYAMALDGLGVSTTRQDATEMTLAGLAAAHELLEVSRT